MKSIKYSYQSNYKYRLSKSNDDNVSGGISCETNNDSNSSFTTFTCDLGDYHSMTFIFQMTMVVT